MEIHLPITRLVKLKNFKSKFIQNNISKSNLKVEANLVQFMGSLQFFINKMCVCVLVCVCVCIYIRDITTEANINVLV